MITDIPTPDDFRVSGLSFLNLAWDSAISLALTLDDAAVKEWDDDGAVTDEYWTKAQHPLATALALTQQGTELLLKAQIIEVSPFLLFVGSPRDWPRGCDRNDIAFSSFRTIDAQDLARAHDTVAGVRLSMPFRQNLEKLRVLRNTVFHSVDKLKRFKAKEILVAVLEVTNALIPNKTWVIVRKDYLSDTAEAGLDDFAAEPIVARELSKAIELLSPAECNRLLKIDKHSRAYYCPDCVERDIGLESNAKSARLLPNTPTSTTAYCYVCERSREVHRMKCGKCVGNVIDMEEEICLTCGN